MGRARWCRFKLAGRAYTPEGMGTLHATVPRTGFPVECVIGKKGEDIRRAASRVAPMIAQLETRHEFIMKIFKIPVVGAFLVLLLLLVPAQLLAMVVGHFAGWEKHHTQALYLGLAAAVSLVLWFLGTKFKILWVPLWLILLAFLGLTLYGVKL